MRVCVFVEEDVKVFDEVTLVSGRICPVATVEPAHDQLHACHAWLLSPRCPFAQSHEPSVLTYICINRWQVGFLNVPGLVGHVREGHLKS